MYLERQNLGRRQVEQRDVPGSQLVHIPVTISSICSQHQKGKHDSKRQVRTPGIYLESFTI